MNLITFTLPPPKPEYREGQYWLHKERKEIFFLTTMGAKYYLFNLTNGEVWSGLDNYKPVEAFDNDEKDFVLVDFPFTVSPNPC